MQTYIVDNKYRELSYRTTCMCCLLKLPYTIKSNFPASTLLLDCAVAYRSCWMLFYLKLYAVNDFKVSHFSGIFMEWKVSSAML